MMTSSKDFSHLSHDEKWERIHQLESELNSLRLSLDGLDQPPVVQGGINLAPIYQRLFYNSTQAKTIFVDGKVAALNPATAQLLGYSSEELYNMPMQEHFKRVHPDDYERIQTIFDQPDLQTPISLQHRIIRKDGGIRWIDVVVKFLIIEEHQVIQVSAVDITLLKAQQESLQYYKFIFENVNDVVISYDLDLTVKSWNPAAVTLYGYTEEEAIGQEMWQLFKITHLDASRDTVRGYFLTQGKWQGEISMRAKSGDEIIVWASATLLHDDDNQPIGVVSIHRNITERRQWEQELAQRIEERTIELETVNQQLQHNQQRYSALIQNFPNGIVGLVNHHLQFEVLGGTGQMSLPLQDTDLVGRRLGDIMPPEIARRDEPALRAALDGESRVQTVAYENGWYRVHTVPIVDDNGDVLAAMVMSQDITQLTRMQQNLLHSEERYRTVLHAIPDTVFVLNQELEFVFVNQSASQWFRLPKDELEGYKLLDLFPQTAQTEFHKTFLDTFRDQQPKVVVAQYQSHRAETTNLSWYEARVFPIPEGILVLLRDITRQREIDEKNREHELARTRVDTIDEMVHNLAHDLRTPLSVIHTSLHLLEHYREPEKQHEKLASIKRQVVLLEKMIENILLLTELDNYDPADLRRTNINQIIIDTIEAIEQHATNKQIQLITHIPDQVIHHQVNPDHLFRAFVNIAENAIFYTPDGNTISIDLQAINNDSFTLTVRDDGIGIAEEDLPHIFERFYRANAARTINQAGNGLGLTIAQQIIQLHHGTISVTSQLDHGTIVTVTL